VGERESANDRGGEVIFKNVDAVPVEMLPDLTRRVLATSDGMMLVEFTFAAGVEVPEHSHPHDQVGYVVSGRMRMVMGDQVSECGPGDSYHAPSNVLHSGRALEPSVLIDVFSPPREDYAVG
jgi:quercetin dioxygenase-like cupin family protein